MKHNVKNPLSNREIYGITLCELGEENKDIVVLDADLSKSTNTYRFKEKFPERFFNMGIAEANMISVAAGLATVGKIPFASTFSVFASTRALEQLRTSIAYPRLNVKIVATNAGIEIGGDGATHQAIEDIAIIRSIPNIIIISPSDPVSTEKLIRAISEYNGPVYVRLGRWPNPYIYNLNEKFEIGKAKIIKEGSDLTIISTGNMVNKCVQASEILNSKGISSTVIDMLTIKPLDCDIVLEYAKKTKHIITVEDHSIIGGLGGAVSEFLSTTYPIKIKVIGIKDTFGTSGRNPEDLFNYFHINTEDIVKEAELFLKFN
ncbi:MAG: transketolase family protein [Actinobacteria bacterium]|nr:transketolase family protein [Actinomycetota bacterium]